MVHGFGHVKKAVTSWQQPYQPTYLPTACYFNAGASPHGDPSLALPIAIGTVTQNTAREDGLYMMRGTTSSLQGVPLLTTYCLILTPLLAPGS